MKRTIIAAAIAASFVIAAAAPAAAEWPAERPIHVIVGFGAGGGTDIVSVSYTHLDVYKRQVPQGATLVEFGSGSSKKARILLRALPPLAAYVPVDICGEMIEQEALELRPDFPGLKVLPVTADITQQFTLPQEALAAPVRIGFFPGSTIGNFEPHEAAAFLRNAARILGAGATLIVGADLVKPVDVLHAAYNDAAGVTAKFNLNLLVRINRCV